MTPEVYELIELSTAHVSPETAQALDEEGIHDVVSYPKGEYGWFVLVRDEEDFSLGEFDHVPDDLKACMKYAQTVYPGIRWIMFDRDADTVSELPVWDW